MKVWRCKQETPNRWASLSRFDGKLHQADPYGLAVQGLQSQCLNQFRCLATLRDSLLLNKLCWTYCTISQRAWGSAVGHR